MNKIYDEGCSLKTCNHSMGLFHVSLVKECAPFREGILRSTSTASISAYGWNDYLIKLNIMPESTDHEFGSQDERLSVKRICAAKNAPTVFLLRAPPEGEYCKVSQLSLLMSRGFNRNG